MINSFTGNITKVLINGKQVHPSGLRSLDIEAGRKLNIEVYFSIIPVGDIAWNDFWTVGVLAWIGSNTAYGSTSVRGGGEKQGKVNVTGLYAPGGRQGINLKLCAIDATSPTAPKR